MSSLSVVISAFNEEKKLSECLSSVSFADEIIVIDNSSTDKTAEIAQKYKAKVYKRENYPMLNINKNFGMSKANSTWILNLDADERVSPELASEIKEILKSSHVEYDGYYIPRKNYIFGKWIQHSGWYPDHQLRLFKNGKARFPERHVHEKMVLDGNGGYLKENIIHLNYETVHQFLYKHFVVYAPSEAEELLARGYEFSMRDAIAFPFKEFLSRFFARHGYKDGFHGLMLSLLLAFYHLAIFALIWEKRGFETPNDKNILLETENELQKAHNDLIYWFYHEKIRSSHNIFYTIYLKIKRRLA